MDPCKYIALLSKKNKILKIQENSTQKLEFKIENILKVIIKVINKKMAYK